MRVATDLGYRPRRVNPFQRLTQSFGSTAFDTGFFSTTLAPMDRPCRKLTKGRTSIPPLLAGLPVMFVTTKGRRSGQLRTTPLGAVPNGDRRSLIGTSFGPMPPPGWVFDLGRAIRIFVLESTG
jgi:hypothetical protein